LTTLVKIGNIAIMIIPIKKRGMDSQRKEKSPLTISVKLAQNKKPAGLKSLETLRFNVSFSEMIVMFCAIMIP
jgi:hypothetical protein